MLWICSGSLGYKSSRYCTFVPIKVLSLPKKKKPVPVKKNKFILHTCECRYDNNMNKAGKSPPPVQTNRNINNPPPILTFKFCIRLAAPCQIQVLLVCNQYSIAKFHFLPVQFYVILSALKK